MINSEVNANASASCISRSSGMARKESRFSVSRKSMNPALLEPMSRTINMAVRIGELIRPIRLGILLFRVCRKVAPIARSRIDIATNGI